MTASQLAEWEAYDKLEPIGEWRGDFRTALLCSIVVNLAKSVYGKKGDKMSDVLEFMPDWAGERPTQKVVKQTMKEMKGILKALAETSEKGR